MTSELRTRDGIGFVRLIDSMGGDDRIVQAARVSYGAGTKTKREDERLIDYLVRNKHTSPLEKVRFEFHVKLPIFTARQWMRHRMGSFNEVSARYSAMPNEIYVPDVFPTQSKSNKQVSGEALPEETQAEARDAYLSAIEHAYAVYLKLQNLGVSREVARMVLPVSLYTEFYWTVDLHNLLHFIGLRLHPHAQENIREYAAHLLTFARQVAPAAVTSWERHHQNSVTLTADEAEQLAHVADVGGVLIRESGLDVGVTPQELQTLRRKLGDGTP